MLAGAGQKAGDASISSATHLTCWLLSGLAWLGSSCVWDALTEQWGERIHGLLRHLVAVPGLANDRVTQSYWLE